MYLKLDPKKDISVTLYFKYYVIGCFTADVLVKHPCYVYIKSTSINMQDEQISAIRLQLLTCVDIFNWQIARLIHC